MATARLVAAGRWQLTGGVARPQPQQQSTQNRKPAPMQVAQPEPVRAPPAARRPRSAFAWFRARAAARVTGRHTVPGGRDHGRLDQQPPRAPRRVRAGDCLHRRKVINRSGRSQQPAAACIIRWLRMPPIADGRRAAPAGPAVPPRRRATGTSLEARRTPSHPRTAAAALAAASPWRGPVSACRRSLCRRDHPARGALGAATELAIGLKEAAAGFRSLASSQRFQWTRSWPVT